MAYDKPPSDLARSPERRRRGLYVVPAPDAPPTLLRRNRGKLGGVVGERNVSIESLVTGVVGRSETSSWHSALACRGGIR